MPDLLSMPFMYKCKDGTVVTGIRDSATGALITKDHALDDALAKHHTIGIVVQSEESAKVLMNDLEKVKILRRLAEF